MDASAIKTKPWYRLRNILLSVVTILFVVFAWFANEVRKVYVGKPNPSHDYRADFRAIAEQAVGRTPGSRDTAWTRLVEAVDQYRAVGLQYEKDIAAGRVDSRPGFDDGSFDFTLVLEGTSLSDYTKRERELVALLRQGGAFDSFLAFAREAPGLEPVEGEGSLFFEEAPMLAGARGLAKARTAAMRLASSRNDGNDVAIAFDELLALGQTMSLQRQGLLSHLVAQAIVVMACEELRHELLEETFDESTCRSILKSFVNRRFVDEAFALEGERLLFHDVVQWNCTDDGSGDGYLIPDSLRNLSGADDSGKGTLLEAWLSRFYFAKRKESVLKYDQFIDDQLVETRKLPADRWKDGIGSTDSFLNVGERHAFVKMMLPSGERFLNSSASTRSQSEATRVMVGIALFYAIHRFLPESLEELVPTVFPVLPVDPIHGRSFEYRMRGTEGSGLPYLLYSTGLDRLDNNGATPLEHQQQLSALSNFGMTGYDAVFTLSRPQLREEQTMDSEADPP